jgi:DNA-binding response OmpR family regulator
MLSLRNLKLLMVEDDPEMARTVERVLARYGHRSTIVRSATEANAVSDVYDCGLFDIDLPDGNGVELAERMLDRGQLTAAVFFSACTDPDMLERAGTVGVFVAKSAGTRPLERAVAEAVSRAAQQLASGAPDTPRSRGGRSSKSGSRRKAPKPG